MSIIKSFMYDELFASIYRNGKHINYKIDLASNSKCSPEPQIEIGALNSEVGCALHLLCPNRHTVYPMGRKGEQKCRGG